MKKKIFILTMMLLTFLGVNLNVLNAQEETITIGSGDRTSTRIPSNSFTYYGYCQQIYTKAELGNEIEAGVEITKVSLKRASNYDYERKWKIYMLNLDDKSSFSNNTDWVSVTETDVVYDGTFSLGGDVNTWIEITLTNNFVYNGGNILLCIQDYTKNDVSPQFAYYTYLSDVSKSCLRKTQDFGDPLTPDNITSVSNPTLDNEKNQIIFTYESSVPAVMPSSVPEITSIEATHNSVTLAWNAVENAKKYNVYTSTGDLVETVNTTSCTIEGLDDLTEYCYQVSAVNGEFETEKSTVSCATTLEAPKERTLVFELKDSYGDGWNGNYLDVYLNGVLEVSYATSSSDGKNLVTKELIISQGTVIKVVYRNDGSYKEENSFTIYYKDGTLINGQDKVSGTGNSTYDVVEFVYGPVLLVEASSYNISPDQTTTLTATAIEFDGDVTYSWSLNGEIVGTDATYNFTPSTTGEYTFTCTVGTIEKSVTINVFANPFAGKQFRVKVEEGTCTGYYLDVYNDNGTIRVESKTERNTQIFTIEIAGNQQYYLKTADGYYIKCETGDNWWNVHANNTYDKTPLVFEYTDGEQFYIKDYDKMTGNSKTSDNNPNNCYFKVQDAKVYCDAPINKNDSESHRTVLWSLEEIIQIETIALTANPEEVTVGENITFTVLQGDTDVTSASKFYIEDEEITNPYTTTVAGTFTIRAEKDGLEATTSITVNEAVEPDPEDPVTPGNGETIYNTDGSVTYNKGLENEYTLIAVQDPNTGVVTIKEDNVYYYGSGTELQIEPKDNNKPLAATVLTIPEKVLFQTEEVTDWVTVTKIADYAFDNLFVPNSYGSYEPGNELNDNFTGLIIPSTIEEIGTYTFGFEMEGGSIICYAQTPPALSSTTTNNPFLSSTYNNTILYVLPESINAYKEAEGWGAAAYSGYYFKNIAPLTIPTFVANEDNNWNNANNWRTYIKNATDDDYTETYGVMPNAGEDVLINGDAIIPAGYTANVGAINIVSGSITIKDGGQLIHTNAGVTVTVEKEIKGYNATREGVASTAWNTISSPIAVLTPTSNVSGLLNGAYDLYYYDEPTHYWINHEQGTNNFTTLDAGRGYLYANENDVTLKFNGVINYDNVSFNLNASSDNEGLRGFNLIGNPFTHDIYMGGNIYSENLIIDGYYSLSKEGQWGAKKASSSAIAPCQSILVQTSSEETINIVKAATAPARSAQAALNITVVNEQYEDNAYVIFNDGKGLNKVGHMNENIPMVYVIDNNEKFAIANIDDANEIALGFEAMTMGEYTIAVKAQDCKFNNMILTDNITGEKTNLMTDSYTFMATTNDEPNRFTLTLNNDNDNDNDFIYIHNNEMIINNIEGNGLVQVYDMMGRSVATYNVSGSANISMETLSNGVYVVRMTDANGVKTQKVVNN